MKVYEGKEGTHNFTLAEGWNLISFTYLPQDKSISSVLSQLQFGVDYDQISSWDPTTNSWKHFVNDTDFNDFTSFEYGKSYEIYVKKTGGVTFTVTGKSPALDITTQVKVGTNFIGPPVKEATPVSTVLSGLTLGTHYSDVKRLNASTGTLESYTAGAFSTFEPGKGYILVGLQNTSFSYGKTETVTTFVYDSTGSRVKKTMGSTTTIYLGKDYDITGSTSTKYIFLGDRRISTRKSDGTLEFIHSDHINSSNIITDSNGNQSGLIEYDPYGSTVTHTGSADPKHKFTGQEEDSSTRLYYYGARYYDPQLGRFITPDPTVQKPFDPQDFNRYAYARNNPVVFTDPTGFGWLASLFNTIGQVIGTVVGAFAGNPELGRRLGGAIGTYYGRGLETMFAGGDFKEIYMAAYNGFAEGYYSLPYFDPRIYKNDPVTNQFTPQTKRLLRELGMGAVAVEILTGTLESTLFKNNRSFAEIQGAKVSGLTSEQQSQLNLSQSKLFRYLQRIGGEFQQGFDIGFRRGVEDSEVLELWNVGFGPVGPKHPSVEVVAYALEVTEQVTPYLYGIAEASGRASLEAGKIVLEEAGETYSLMQERFYFLTHPGGYGSQVYDERNTRMKRYR
jgi:RHS repeat-associated protein